MSCRAERRQRGLASLEFVLITPVLIIVTFLAMAMVKLGHLRLDMQISARNQAYEKAYGWKMLFANIDDETRWYVPGTVVDHPDASANAGDNFYAASATGHERFNILRDSVARENKSMNPMVGAAHTRYQAVRMLGRWQIDVREQYAVVAQPLWLRTQVPIGYDQYLYDELKKVRFVIPGIPGASLIQDIPLISHVPGLEDIDEFDFDDLYSGVASDAVIDVFPGVVK